MPHALADSPAIRVVLNYYDDHYLMPISETQWVQTQVVWVSMVAYGEDFSIDRVVLALPARGAEISTTVNASAAYGDGLGPISVSFAEFGEDVLLSLVPVATAPAAAAENTFSPGTGGVVWPSLSDLCRRAPRPEVTPQLLIQFTDLGAQFSLEGDALTDGYITGGGGTDDELHPAPAAPAKARGRPRGSGKAAASKAKSKAPTVPVIAVPVLAGPPPPLIHKASSKAPLPPPSSGPPTSLVDEIRATIRAEMVPLQARIAALEAARSASPVGPRAVDKNQGAFDPLFGVNAPPDAQAVLKAAREAQQLLRVGAPGSSRDAVNPFGIPGMGANGVPPGTVPKFATPRSTATDFAGPAAPPGLPLPVPGKEAATQALLTRIAVALENSGVGEASRAPPAASNPLGGAANLAEYLNLLGGAVADAPAGGLPAQGRVGGLWALERIKRTRRERPELVVEAAENIAKEQMGVLEGEAWNWRRHAEQELQPCTGNFTTLKRMIAMVAAALDEGRSYGLPQQQALLVHIYKVLEATARDPNHEMQWPWPLLGISDPGGRKRSNWAPGEAAALVAFHRDEAALEDSKKKLGGGKGTAPASSTEGAITNAAQVPEWLRKQIGAAAVKGKGKKGDGKGGKNNESDTNFSASP